MGQAAPPLALPLHLDPRPELGGLPPASTSFFYSSQTFPPRGHWLSVLLPPLLFILRLSPGFAALSGVSSASPCLQQSWRRPARTRAQEEGPVYGDVPSASSPESQDPSPTQDSELL